MGLIFFPAVLEKEADSDFGVFFPDIDGCVAAGSDAAEALRNAEEALQFHIEGLIEQGQALPVASDPTTAKDRYRTPGFVRIAMIRARVPGRAKRINITLEEQLLQGIDEAASARGTTRSSFLAEAARKLIKESA